MAIMVANKHHMSHSGPNDFYIGRGSALGNPYKVKPWGPYERDESVLLYEAYLRAKIAERHPGIMRQLECIAESAMSDTPTRLVCFCKPKACHGDVIKKLITEAISRSDQAA